MLSAEMVRLLERKADALWADAKKVKEPFALQESGNDIGMLLDDRAELLKILDGYNLGGDCLICTDTAAEHESRFTGCPCCWGPAKRTMVDVMRWARDAGRAELLALLREAHDCIDAAAHVLEEASGYDASNEAQASVSGMMSLKQRIKAVLPAEVE